MPTQQSSGGGTGAGLAAGGVAGLISAPFQILGSLSEQQKMNQMIEAELARQRAYQQAGQDIFNTHLEQNTLPEVNKDIVAGQQQAMHGYQNAPMIAQLGHASLPSLGASFLNPRVAGAVNTSNQNAAGPQGYTEWGVKQALQGLKARSKLLQNNQFAQNSQSVLGPEIQAASQSQSGLKAFGGLLGDAAGVAAMAAI